ncbi:MAG: hypothetical protein FD163_1514 [Hyphomonadaceae bacterium]|nr:MAG: hypothetical protein FD128_1512 [Hyphomonadaceae bacterium]KAF0184817.1 MAG: hypothetical protein FD163_1514 [Hyphomonadaceae bacterium]
MVVMKKLFLPVVLVSIFIALYSQNSVFASEVRALRANQVFQFWDKYLTLPPHIRDGFNLLYTIRSRSGPLPELYLVNGAQRTLLRTDRNGVILNPPDLENFRRATVELPNSGTSDSKAKGSGISVNLDIEPIIPLGRSVAVSAINNALSDYRDGIRIAGGPAALMAPKFTSIAFKGAQSGFVNFSNSRQIPLVKQGDALVFTPSAANARGAINLAFNTAPNRADYAR